MIIRVPTVGIVSVPVSIEDLTDGPGETDGHSLEFLRVKEDESGLEYTNAGSGRYRQFTFIVTGGDFSFIKDINGRPVMALIPLE